MANYCQYAVLNFHWKPKEFLRLSKREKAFVIACIDNKVQAEKNEIARIKAR